MESYAIRDELEGSTSIIDEKNNIDQIQEMEFSTPISEVLDVPSPMMSEPPAPASAQKKTVEKSAYPFNLKKPQMEALVAGVAGVIGFSDFVQLKLIDMIPQAMNDSGKLTITGYIITIVVIAVIFYFLRNFTVNR